MTISITADPMRQLAIEASETSNRHTEHICIRKIIVSIFLCPPSRCGGRRETSILRSEDTVLGLFSFLRYKAGILGYSMAEMEASCLLPIPIPKK